MLLDYLLNRRKSQIKESIYGINELLHTEPNDVCKEWFAKIFSVKVLGFN